MRLKEKLYRRFCAPEVRMLLDHMEENFQDFEEDYIDKKPWRRLMKSNTYTTVERTVIKMAYYRLEREHERQQLLGKIIAQKLNPEPEKKSDDFMDAHRYATALNQHNQTVAAQQYGQLNQLAQYGQQYTDPRAIYGRTP
jgi:hypothetical protein